MIGPRRSAALPVRRQDGGSPCGRNGRDARCPRATGKMPVVPVRLFDYHAGADVAEIEEAHGVPVREAEATMGLRAADLLRPGRAVDAVGGEGEPDPGKTHGVVGARRVDVLLVIAGRVGRVGVVRVGDGRDHVDFARGRTLVLLRRDRAGEERDHLPLAVEHRDLAPGERHAQDVRARTLGLRLPERLRKEGDLHGGADGRIGPAHVGIEGAERRLGEASALRVHLHQRLVVHLLHCGLLGGGARDAHDGAAVLGRHVDRREEVRLAGEQLLPRLRLHPAVREGDAVHGAVGGEGRVCFVPRGSVQGVHGEPAAVEADLEREDVSVRIRQVRRRAELRGFIGGGLGRDNLQRTRRPLSQCARSRTTLKDAADGGGH